MGQVPEKVLKIFCSGQLVPCSFHGVVAARGFRLMAGRFLPALAVQLHEPILRWFGFLSGLSSLAPEFSLSIVGFGSPASGISPVGSAGAW